MTTFVIIISGLIFILFIALFYVYYLLQQRQIEDSDASREKDDLSKITSLDWKVKALLLLAFVLVCLSFLAPFVFTRLAINNDLDFLNTGQIGDTIGGLMNPFITLSGVVVTGLAFYIQYRANLLQRALFLKEQAESKDQLQLQIDNQNEQIKLQQFESQFYEMLKLHRENVSEMRITGYDFEETKAGLRRFEKVTEGRRIFVVMKAEFEIILWIYTRYNELDKAGYRKCYKVFFSGVESYEKDYPNDVEFIQALKHGKEQHQYPKRYSINSNVERKSYLGTKLHLSYKPFSGHAQNLGHYFRHLFLAVKSIANSDTVTKYEDRMKYLRLLRAQLSNHEQTMLFYNWLSDYGKSWEDESNSFLTEYCMIHNLWYEDLLDSRFISDNVNYLKTKKVMWRTGRMFEIDG